MELGHLVKHLLDVQATLVITLIHGRTKCLGSVPYYELCIKNSLIQCGFFMFLDFRGFFTFFQVLSPFFSWEATQQFYSEKISRSRSYLKHFLSPGSLLKRRGQSSRIAIAVVIFWECYGSNGMFYTDYPKFHDLQLLYSDICKNNDY